MSKILCVEHVSASYTTKRGEADVLQDISLCMKKGEAVGLVGESGCGKTTLALCILGELPFTGRIMVGGEVVHHYTRRKKEERMAMARLVQAVFQDPLASLDPLCRVRGTLVEGPAIHGIGTREERDASAASMLERVGLSSSFLYRRPHELSGGQRQRVLIASALMLRPALLIADEVTSSLDAKSCDGVLDLLSSLNKEEGLSILFISHDASATAKLCSRVVELGEEGSSAPCNDDTLH